MRISFLPKRPLNSDAKTLPMLAVSRTIDSQQTVFKQIVQLSGTIYGKQESNARVNGSQAVAHGFIS
jgi:hypothetical protein